MRSSSCFSSMFLLPQLFLWIWVAFSALFWVFALLLVEKSIMFHCTTVYQPLCTLFSWFCSFHSASIPGDHSISYGISPVYYSFEHNSIPSPTYFTICSAIPQLKGIPSFSNFLPPQRVQLFLYKSFFLWSLWGINPAVVWLGWRADSLNSKLPSRMVGSIHKSTSNALLSQFCHTPCNIHHFPLLSC